MGGRSDTDFWKYMTNESATDFVNLIRGNAKTRMPSRYDFPTYYGSGGGPLYSHVMYQIGLIDPKIALNDLLKVHSTSEIADALNQLQDEWIDSMSHNMTSKEFHNYRLKLKLRDIRPSSSS